MFKRTIIAILLLILAIQYTAVGSCKENIPVYVHGDADFDGELSSVDVTAIQRYLATVPRPIFDRIAADYDSSGDIEIFDVTYIQRKLADISIKPFQPYPQMNNYISDYYHNVSYEGVDYNKSYVHRFIPDSSENVYLSEGVELNIPQSGYLYVWDGEHRQSYRVNAGSYTVYNLTPGRESTYLLTDEEGNHLNAGLVYPEPGVRMIRTTSVGNVRDLGGWTCDGGTIKYGMIYRGRELSGNKSKLSNEDKQLFLDVLGISSEIDLRSNKEVKGEDNIYGTDDDITSSVLGDDVGYLRRPISAYDSAVDLSNGKQCEYIRNIISQITKDVSESKPCYIHCVEGADRAGTVCALIEALCGMSQSDIDRDYELTSFSGESRARNNSSWVSLMDYLNSFPGDNLRDRAIYYLLSIGVTIDEMNALRKAVINGDPEDVTRPTDLSYTNQLSMAQYPVGTVIGVMNQKRWSSSGTLKDSGSDSDYAKASGYIAVASGDVIHMSGILFGADTVQKNTTCYIWAFNSDLSAANAVSAFELSSLPTSKDGFSNICYDEYGNVIQFTVEYTGYITICTNSSEIHGGISNEALITINELI